MDKTSLGDRMKGYESVTKIKLMKRTPAIIRLDGKAFHTWTRRLSKDDCYSDDLHNMMTFAAEFLVRNIQNAELAYVQSDEISILLNDWKKLNTEQWYGNAVQKMVSVSASQATIGFNFKAMELGYINQLADWAAFDSRVYNLPKEEVVNYFIWRQQDATRNSINMLGQHHFSHKALHGKNVSQVQDMLMIELGINWNDVDTWKKRGSCIIRNPNELDSRAPVVTDETIPIFSRDREYIEKFMEVDDD